jgi:hypothetical protein
MTMGLTKPVQLAIALALVSVALVVFLPLGAVHVTSKPDPKQVTKGATPPKHTEKRVPPHFVPVYESPDGTVIVAEPPKPGEKAGNDMFPVVKEPFTIKSGDYVGSQPKQD